MNIKEILVLHHSHLDIGYTHSQQLMWRLQYDFIEQALSMMEQTSDWPKASQPKWTIEATTQILTWLKHADQKALKQMQRFIEEGRIGMAGMQYNTTPLCNLEQLIRQLEPVNELKERFSCKINAAIQHDVNGIPWTIADLLPSFDISTLIMGINPHLGGAAAGRPSLFRWQGPSGNEILVVNGEHYTMFDQQLNTTENSIEAVQQGLERYLGHLEEIGYEQDFLYLTSSNVPVCWDNSPPNMEVAQLIRRCNESGLLPPIRYVTPNDVAAKAETVFDKLPIHQGDWTDFWNFGCASSAYETAVNQRTKQILFKSELINAFTGDTPDIVADAIAESWESTFLYDEHTWGCDESMNTRTYNTRSQWYNKANNAYEGREQAFYSLLHGLERFTGNPDQANDLQGIMLYNLSGKDQRVPVIVPQKWRREGKQLSTARYRWDMQADHMEDGDFDRYAPVTIPAYGWVSLPFSDLQEEEQSSLLDAGRYVHSAIQAIVSFDVTEEVKTYRSYIESPFYRIEYDQKTGRITSVYDRTHTREILDTDSPWTFFEIIREYPDPRIDPSRQSYFQRDFVRLLDDESCWKTNWKAIRTGTNRFLSSSVTRTGRSITLELLFALDNIEDIIQKITLYADDQCIDASISMMMHDHTAPESFYLAFPLALSENWEAEYLTANTHVRLDEQQLDGSSKGWVTTESTASMYDADNRFTLITPDAPMVMFGDFNFGRAYESIDRNRNPLLLSWILTNYWETNFRASQPGQVSFSYRIRTDRSRLTSSEVKAFTTPISSHPLVNCAQRSSGTFFTLDTEDDVDIIAVSAGNKQDTIMFRLLNTVDRDVQVILNIQDILNVLRAAVTKFDGEYGRLLNVSENRIQLSIKAHEIINLTLEFTRNER